MSLHEREEEHESFGMMSFSRIQCGKAQTLFGSDLQHDTIIAMRLHHAIKGRSLSRDWYHAKGLITEVYMSQNQFSELITSMNMGDGIPVTLRMTEKDGRLEEPDFVSVTEVHRNEFKTKARGVAEDADALLESMKEVLEGSGTVEKADRNALLSKAAMLLQEIKSNMPFMEEQFAEAMDKTVTDAKGTIEAFVQRKVTEAGMEALGMNNEVKLIEEKE